MVTRKILAKNGEPQRYSWECRRRRVSLFPVSSCVFHSTPVLLWSFHFFAYWSRFRIHWGLGGKEVLATSCQLTNRGGLILQIAVHSFSSAAVLILNHSGGCSAIQRQLGSHNTRSHPLSPSLTMLVKWGCETRLTNLPFRLWNYRIGFWKGQF